MCFSATASFSSAALLGIVGIATLKTIDRKSQIALALIPLLFALQQFSEGVIWLNLSSEEFNPILKNIAEYTFLLFAFVVWPTWMPASMLLVEKIIWRKVVLSILFLCGLFISAYHLSFFPEYKPDVKMIGHSIQYVGDLKSFKFIYAASVILPCFFSSYKNMWIFGVLIGLAVIITNYFYAYAFVSTWCFCSAILSTVLYKIIRDHVSDGNFMHNRKLIDQK